MKMFLLIVLSKYVLKYIFVKLQDFEKETEFRFLLGSPTNTYVISLSFTTLHKWLFFSQLLPRKGCNFSDVSRSTTEAISWSVAEREPPLEITWFYMKFVKSVKSMKRSPLNFFWKEETVL